MTKPEILEYQVKELMKSLQAVTEDVKKIMENHLPHLQQDLAQIKSEGRILTIINIGAVILAILVSRFIFPNGN